MQAQPIMPDAPSEARRVGAHNSTPERMGKRQKLGLLGSVVWFGHLILFHVAIVWDWYVYLGISPYKRHKQTAGCSNLIKKDPDAPKPKNARTQKLLRFHKKTGNFPIN